MEKHVTAEDLKELAKISEHIAEIAKRIGAKIEIEVEPGDPIFERMINIHPLPIHYEDDNHYYMWADSNYKTGEKGFSAIRTENHIHYDEPFGGSCDEELAEAINEHWNDFWSRDDEEEESA